MKKNASPNLVPACRSKNSAGWSKVKLDVTTALDLEDKLSEITNQDYHEIRKTILSKRRHGVLDLRDAFVDESFPPDKGSLTYVYSGDDKYDRMSFKRPLEFHTSPQLKMPHGVCPIRHSMRRWTGRQWLLHALSAVSLHPTYMNRLIPFPHNREQNFASNYTGLAKGVDWLLVRCFYNHDRSAEGPPTSHTMPLPTTPLTCLRCSNGHCCTTHFLNFKSAFLFVLWRFGEWVEVVVDDHLPILEGQPAFCPAFDDPPVFWPALLEKAYAKCNKAYETIEVGNPLSALTDFTGAICERYKPNECITNDLFHVMYKSCANRSLIVGWRSMQSFRESTIRPGPASADYTSGSSIDQEAHGPNLKGPHMFVVTGATRFPLRDGRMLEMIRLNCPHDQGTTWWGDFSVKNPQSWHSLHPTFAENFKPKECLDGNEFWIPYIEFCRNFADLIVCSSVEPYIGFDPPRHGRKLSSRCDEGIYVECESPASPTSVFGELNDVKTSQGQLEPPPGENFYEKRGSIEITVQESITTIKVDTVRNWNSRKSTKDPAFFVKRRPTHEANGSGIVKQTQILPNKSENVLWKYNNRIGNVYEGKDKAIPTITMTSAVNIAGKTQNSTMNLISRNGCSQNPCSNCPMHRDASVASNLSDISAVSNNSLSDTESTNSTSEINIRLKSSQSRYNVDRPSSAPAKSPNHFWNPAKGFDASIFETRVDFFRPQGSWKSLMRHMGCWTKSTSGGPPSEKESHAKNPRVAFSVLKADAVNEVIPSELHGKCHIVISLLQDQRRGSNTYNSMLVDIGFCVYRSKSPEKDEKRHLSKVQLIRDVMSESESREVTARFDLDPGYYMVVPYTSTVGQEGHYLLRILCEKDQVAGKTGCIIS